MVPVDPQFWRSLLSAIRTAPRWLAERETIRCENQIIALLRTREADGAPLACAGDLERYAESNRRRSEVFEGDRAFRFVGRLYEFQVRAPGPVRLVVRLAWRALRSLALLGARRSPDPSSRPAGRVAATLEVPFDPGFAHAAPPQPVGAVIHAFYPELMAEIRSYLENIPGRIDIFISTDTEAKRQAIQQAMAGWTAGAVEVRLSPNRGRDIAPKLITFRDVYDSHPIVLHLHTKKSPHDSFLRLWRYLVYETLIGSPTIVSGILSAFAQEPRLGMVAAEHFFPSRGGIQWSENFTVAAHLARRMGLSIHRGSPLDFPAGSMFWVRSAALAPLLALDLSAEDFPVEAGQTDGTLAHAVERLYFHTCERAGLSWTKVCRRELLYAYDPPLAQIDQDEGLRRLVSSAPRLVSRRAAGPPREDR